MNFLAHSHLSFQHQEILVGNMISDFVKGKKKYEYSAGIQHGIALHRQIDQFTDNHAATRDAKEFLKPAVGPYAGAFTDVAYDHFLANDPHEFTDASLRQHAAETYNILTIYQNVLPDRFVKMLPYMKSQNWLYNYKTLSGAESGFGGVARRASYLNSSHEVFNLFQKHYSQLNECYNVFFPSVKEYSIAQFKQLI